MGPQNQGVLQVWPVGITSLALGSVQFSSVAQSCPTLCEPMNCSVPGLPVHHQLPVRRPLILSLFLKFIFNWRISLYSIVPVAGIRQWEPAVECTWLASLLPPLPFPNVSLFLTISRPPSPFLSDYQASQAHSPHRPPAPTCVHAQVTLALVLWQVPLPPCLPTWEMSPR